ncbi:hypothetical protein FJY93_04260 [Candidatus Kaiserbacteria bacterium]|nr:hypothetical protein [Candidatus Kaiserbacteria bacterium]
MEKKKTAQKKRSARRRALDIRIPPEVHKEYVSFHSERDIGSRTKWALEHRDLLLKRKTPLEEKKEILSILAHSPELKALYGIQKYLKNPDQKLESFAALAWQECEQRVLERGMEKLFGSRDFVPPLIIGGLGGDAQNMRYQFVLTAIGSEDIVKENMAMLTRVFEKEARVKGERIEEITYRPNVIVCSSLISHNAAVGNHIERIIAAINAEKEILRNHYLVVNTHEIADDEIAEYLASLE